MAGLKRLAGDEATTTQLFLKKVVFVVVVSFLFGDILQQRLTTKVELFNLERLKGLNKRIINKLLFYTAVNKTNTDSFFISSATPPQLENNHSHE